MAMTKTAALLTRLFKAAMQAPNYPTKATAVSLRSSPEMAGTVAGQTWRRYGLYPESGAGQWNTHERPEDDAEKARQQRLMSVEPSYTKPPVMPYEVAAFLRQKYLRQLGK